MVKKKSKQKNASALEQRISADLKDAWNDLTPQETEYLDAISKMGLRDRIQEIVGPINGVTKKALDQMNRDVGVVLMRLTRRDYHPAGYSEQIDALVKMARGLSTVIGYSKQLDNLRRSELTKAYRSERGETKPPSADGPADVTEILLHWARAAGALADNYLAQPTFMDVIRSQSTGPGKKPNFTQREVVFVLAAIWRNVTGLRATRWPDPYSDDLVSRFTLFVQAVLNLATANGKSSKKIAGNDEVKKQKYAYEKAIRAVVDDGYVPALPLRLLKLTKNGTGL